MKLRVSKEVVTFKIDTGCSVTIMNESKFKETRKKKQRPPLHKTKLTLKSYTGEKINVVGMTDVQVKSAGQVKVLPLVVVTGKGPNLLGRGWLEAIKLKWDEIKHLTTETLTLQEVLAKNDEVFKKELGQLKGMKATIHVSPDAHSKFYRPRSVPYAMRVKVEKELDRLLK